MGWKGRERQGGNGQHPSVLMDINNLEIRSLLTQLSLGFTLVVKRESDAGSVRGTLCNLSRFSLNPQAAAFHRSASCQEEEACVFHDSITIL